jgi:hypothetical protein
MVLAAPDLIPDLGRPHRTVFQFLDGTLLVSLQPLLGIPRGPVNAQSDAA